MHSALLARLEMIVREQIASNLTVVEDAVVRFFGDANRATDSSPDTKVISLIQAAVSRYLAENFRGSAFYFTVGETVQKCASEL